MKLFFYEYATAGGAWDRWHLPALVEELTCEGAAMHDALYQDLVAAGHDVQTLRTLDNENDRRSTFYELAHSADAVILLAPETGGILLSLVELVESWQRPLLSPGSAFVRITSNKQATAGRLREEGVPAPEGFLVPAGGRIKTKMPWAGPAVCKPCDGAGSWGVAMIDSIDKPLDFDARVERFYPGIAASVAVLCGAAGPVALEPCLQSLGGASGFQYLGGALPLDFRLAMRARRLALRAIEALPPATGYVGVDIVLGSAADGAEDAVIEVNPRLTTSYVGLRRAYDQNVAAAWLDVAQGRPPQLPNPKRSLEFSPNGAVRLG